MAEKDLKIKVSTLKLSEAALEQLKLSGIDRLDDFNTFNLKELKMLLGDYFEEILTLMKKHHLPSKTTNLNLSNELVEILSKSRILSFSQLVKYDKRTLYKLLENEKNLLNELNELLSLYGFEKLIPFVEGDSSYHIEDDEIKVLDIDIEARKRIKVEQSRKGYGSRAYSHFKIRIASPHEIRQWSYGEVLTHETINYRTSKPEVGGLFCEKIFGPTKDYQCSCGTKKQSGNKGQICPKCGIEITESKVRRERMGHIQLEAPVVHTWYTKSSPSRLAMLLGLKAKQLEEVVYYASYIVTDPGTAPLNKKQILSMNEYSELIRQYRRQFVAQTGAEAIKTLLMELDLEAEVISLRKKIKTTSKQKRDKAIKRLDVIEAFKNSDNKPEWMVMDIIPVIPPDLRPMVALDGGRFATTDLNDLYRRILNRNNRLKRLKEQITAPRLMIINEQRLLQEAVDALIDNSKRGRKAAVERGRNLKSLSDMLRGKQGRLRQNLLGKRVDYSARSVIIVGPDLEMYEAGIPREMAIVLFKPFVLRELYAQGLDRTNANRKYESMDDDVWKTLERVVVEHPVLLNRAPTLHRLGIQAFQPKLIDGKAIRLHPLVTPAFNADFDGDQMAVHLPLSNEAQAEARLLMLSSNNILNPKDGMPVVTPSQDMVLGNYYLTIEEKLSRNNILDKEIQKRHDHLHRNEGRFFYDLNEANLAYEKKEIGLHTRIVINTNAIKQAFREEHKNTYLVTTYGKLVFNQVLPDDFYYLNEPTVENLEHGTPDKYFLPKGVDPKDYMDQIDVPEPFKKSFLSLIISRVFKLLNVSETSKILDKYKDLGFKYSTIAGITISYSDINVYSKKKETIDKTLGEIDQISTWYEEGEITDEERRVQVISKWEDASESIKVGLIAELDQDNHIYMMTNSGARGSINSFVQLSGMRGLMRNPKGDVIEVPVQASFREGLTVSEFFISTHGARKGSTDTALKTAESGYLTRRLVDVSQEVIIVEDDCGSEKGTLIGPIYEDGNGPKDKNRKIIVQLRERLIGRYASRPVINPKNKEVIVGRNELITEEIAELIEELGFKEIEIRTVLNSIAENGVSAKSYGRNLATNTPAEVGDAVGVVAAQSIGEPGTQLTMRTFHTGGVASASDITQGLPRIQELFEARKPKGEAKISEVNGRVQAVNRQRNGTTEVIINEIKDDGTELEKDYKYIIDPNVDLYVRKGTTVIAGQKLCDGNINPKELLRVVSAEAAQTYLIEEVQKVYRAQEVEISDKHIEVIIRQMFRRVYVVTEGDTDLLPGTEVSVVAFKRAVRDAMEQGRTLPVGRPILLGITRASLRSDSFLSAASFQETTKILTNAAVRSSSDELHGLKENVIIGGLIPAGTGILTDKSFAYDAPNTFYEEEE